MADTKIEWCDVSWSPVTGCTKVSEGCQNCYAERMAKRLAGRFGYPKDGPFRVVVHKNRFSEPIRWRKPRRIFVCSMGDLFHDDVPDEAIAAAFATIDRCQYHKFLILTKRPCRMRELLTLQFYTDKVIKAYKPTWPLKNVWLGVSISNQEDADNFLPILLQIPAKVRFVSIEPMLEPVELPWLQYGFLDKNHHNILDWVILGGETGPKARPMYPDWVRSVRDQCREAGVPFFFKNMGSAHEPELAGKITAGRLIDGKMWEEWPRG